MHEQIKSNQITNIINIFIMDFKHKRLIEIIDDKDNINGYYKISINANIINYLCKASNVTLTNNQMIECMSKTNYRILMRLKKEYHENKLTKHSYNKQLRLLFYKDAQLKYRTDKSISIDSFIHNITDNLTTLIKDEQIKSELTNIIGNHIALNFTPTNEIHNIEMPNKTISINLRNGEELSLHQINAETLNIVTSNEFTLNFTNCKIETTKIIVIPSIYFQSFQQNKDTGTLELHNITNGKISTNKITSTSNPLMQSISKSKYHTNISIDCTTLQCTKIISNISNISLIITSNINQQIIINRIYRLSMPTTNSSIALQSIEFNCKIKQINLSLFDFKLIQSFTIDTSNYYSSIKLLYIAPIIDAPNKISIKIINSDLVELKSDKKLTPKIITKLISDNILQIRNSKMPYHLTKHFGLSNYNFMQPDCKTININESNYHSNTLVMTSKNDTMDSIHISKDLKKLKLKMMDITSLSFAPNIEIKHLKLINCKIGTVSIISPNALSLINCKTVKVINSTTNANNNFDINYELNKLILSYSSTPDNNRDDKIKIIQPQFIYGAVNKGWIKNLFLDTIILDSNECLDLTQTNANIKHSYIKTAKTYTDINKQNTLIKNNTIQ